MENKDNLLSEVEFDALKAAEKYLENCRKHLKDVMKPAEKAASDLEKATATEKVRLQGTKETKAPNLKPYTESVPARNRFEIGKLITEAKRAGRPWKIGRCSEELEAQGYRYTFYTTTVAEAKTFTKDKKDNRLVLKEDVDLIPVDDDVVELDDVETVQLGGEAPAEGEEQPLTAMDVLKAKLDIHGEDGKVFVALKGTSDDEDAIKLEFEVTEDEFDALSAEFKGDEAEEPEAEAPVKEPVEEPKPEEEPEAEEPEDETELEEGADNKKQFTPISREDTIRLHNARMGKKMSSDKEIVKDEELRIDESAHISLDDLKLFKPWGGATDIWNLIVSQDKLDALDTALEDMYPEGLTATDLNDILWFEQDWIFDKLDINPTDLQKAPAEDIIDGEAEIIEPEAEGDEE